MKIFAVIILLSFAMAEQSSFAATTMLCEKVFSGKVGSDVSIIPNAFSSLDVAEKNIALENPKWLQGLFFGRAINPGVDPYIDVYTSNLTQSARFFFDNFIQTPVGKYNEFFKLFKQQHAVAVLGQDEMQPYMGETSPTQFVLQMGRWKVSEARTKKEVEARILAAKRKAGKLRKKEINIDLTEYVNTPYYEPARSDLFFKLAEGLVKIEGVPEQYLPKNKVEKQVGLLGHEYPAAAGIEFYIQRMFTLYATITSCRDCSRVQILEYLSDYYHTGINAHIFERVNHSLLMTQVNVIAMSMGLDPVPHQVPELLGLRVDIAALVMSSENFKHYFVGLWKNQL